jgi:hypothetical protein
MNARSLLALAGAASLLAACGRGDAREAAPAAPVAGVVDSAFTPAQALARFRAETPGAPVTALDDGSAPSRDSLVARFVVALERGDSAAFAPMLLTRREFADVYYETDPQALPPYELPPETMWMQMQSHSAQGLGRALLKYGGRPLGFHGYRCEGERVQGENRISTGCVLELRPRGGEPVTVRLFGGVMERGGRYKFLSYANGL